MNWAFPFPLEGGVAPPKRTLSQRENPLLPAPLSNGAGDLPVFYPDVVVGDRGFFLLFISCDCGMENLFYDAQYDSIRAQSAPRERS